ncbi:MAG TPA: hypothetical protein VGL59_00295 [Polyangia bacterium]
MPPVGGGNVQPAIWVIMHWQSALSLVVSDSIETSGSVLRTPKLPVPQGSENPIIEPDRTIEIRDTQGYVVEHGSGHNQFSMQRRI